MKCVARYSSSEPQWHPSKRTRRLPFLGVLLVGLAVAALTPVSPLAAAQPPADDDPEVSQGPVVVYLVRHAERGIDGTDDPPLTLAGEIRARELRDLLKDAGLTHVYSTDWKLTRDAARPIAEELGVEPTIYDPSRLEGLAAALRRTPGTHFVVGHRNTTPMLVAALGGYPFDPIAEFEYDRLYILVIHPGQTPATMLLRFGSPYVEGSEFGFSASGAIAPGADPAVSNCGGCRGRREPVPAADGG